MPRARKKEAAPKAAEKDAILDIINQASDAVATKFKDPFAAQVAEVALMLPTIWASTGSLALDALCCGKIPGGFPVGEQGRVIHLAGEWSTGKSLILDHLFKSTIALGGFALCSETEGSRDPHFARAIGLDLSRVVIQRPETVEEMFDMGLAWHDEVRKAERKARRPNAPILWGMDSLDSTESNKSSETGLSEGGGWRFGGGRPEAFAAGLRKVVRRTVRYPTTLVMLNQTRENVGVMFGPKRRTPGGNPPHFYASLEIMLTPGAKGRVRSKTRTMKMTAEQRKRFGLRAKEEGAVVGRWIKARISKTKIAPTMDQECEFYIDFGKGVDYMGGYLELLLRQGQADMDGEKVILFDSTTTGGKRTFASQAKFNDFIKKSLEESMQ